MFYRIDENTILKMFQSFTILIILLNMEISILAAMFKIVYLVIFMFIFVKPMGKKLFKLINIKKGNSNNEGILY